MTVAVQSTRTTQEELMTRLANRRLVVYTGTLESYQGIDILIRSFRYVLEQEPNAFLLIVGGTIQQVDECRLLADRCGIGQNCHFTGRVPQPEAKFYADHAAVQISSRVSGTNTPLKVYEQLARGIPIVATNIYSHTQFLDESVAFLVEPEPQDMARGILAALLNAEESQHKAINAQALYEEKYSRKVYKDKMKRLFENLGVLGNGPEIPTHPSAIPALR